MRLATALASALILTAAPLSAAPHAALGAARAVVEIGPRAEQRLDARFTRRLIELELSDVEVPADPRSALAAALFFRVLWLGDAGFRVELWERGALHGARAVAARGGTKLLSRRIALAAAELARRLSQQRTALRRVLAAQRKPRPDTDAGSGRPNRGTRVLSSGVAAVQLGGGAAWLAGPNLGLRAEFSPHLHVGLAGAYLGGRLRHASSTLTWAELATEVAWRKALSASVGFELGAQAGVAVVHAGAVQSMDRIAGQHESWSARAVLRTRFGLNLSRKLELGVGPELGLLLRAVPFTASAGPDQLRGAWLGLSAVLLQAH